ncbi:MAG: aminoglycoside phosphotransferase family protein [Candidatus Brocadiaceae bacterium]|jgi:fructosamine-3-kinase
MVFDTSVISEQCATELLRQFLGRELTVTAVRRMHGGMVNSVLELTTDGTPERVVAKLNAQPGHGGFEHELRVLRWYRQHTQFPVPEPYGCDTSGELFPGSCLMMERLPGDNLAHVHLSADGRAQVEREMARIVARLHEHKRGTYGSALEPERKGPRRWLERFGPRIRKEFEAAAGRLSSEARRSIRRTLDELDRWLPESGDPTLVHGDLWATNIIVDPSGPRVTGFVDGGANYADVEYELAYLLVFNTAGDPFFGEYGRHHAVRDGFPVRCRVYWLNTMMLHVRVFGDAHYVRACERLARELEALRPTV